MSILMVCTLAMPVMAEGDNGTNNEAKVVNINGDETEYETLSKALSNAPAGSTVYLLKDVTLTNATSTVNYGITLNLNGYSIDGSSVTNSSKGVVSLSTNYGGKQADDNTMRLTNSKDTGGEIKGPLPLYSKSGNSKIMLPLEITGNIRLISTIDGDLVKLESSSFLLYSDTAASLFKNGMFRVTDEDGKDRIYGSYANAIENSSNGIVTLMNDYTGTDVINSGNTNGTLELAGHSYTYTGPTEMVNVNNPNITLTIKNGSLHSTNDQAVGASLIGAGAGGSNMNNRGLILENVIMTVDGSDVYGIVTNGTETGNSVKLINSTLNVENGYGIYFPSSGDVLINNSVINAKYVGVQMCAGNLTVKGENTKITTTNEPVEKTTNDGVIADGSAISIVERDGYKDLGTVTIENGTFDSKNADAVKTYKFNNENKTEEEWENANYTVEVSGGSFSSDPSEYVKEDTPTANVTNSGEENPSLYVIGEKSIQEAAKVAESGDKLEITNGSVDLTGVKEGVIVANAEENTQGSVTVNEKPVEPGKEVQAPAMPDAEEPSQPSDDNDKPSSSKPSKDDESNVSIDSKDSGIEVLLSSSSKQSLLKDLESVSNQILNENTFDSNVISKETATNIKEALLNGDILDVVVSLGTDVSNEDRKVFMDNDLEVTKYFTVEVNIVSGDKVLGTIKSLSKALEIEVDIDLEDNLEYSVYRLHDGSLEFVDILEDSDKDSRNEFFCDRFSVFAITYKVKGHGVIVNTATK